MEGSDHVTEKPSYRSWQQVAGYFDGDGSVGVEIVRYVLRFRIRYVDTWKEQVDSIRDFLLRSGFDVPPLLRDNKNDSRSAYRVEIRTVDDLLKVAKAMRSYCVKKANDLQITIDYLEDKITGDVAVERFNAEVKSGRRSGYIRESNLPYTRSEGIRSWRLSNARRARAAYAVNVPEDVVTKIKQDRNLGGMGHYRLAKKYGYSESVVRRILRTP